MPKSVSFNRHMLGLLCREMGDLVKTLITRKPFVKGSIYELKRLCGKPNCKCTRGQLHRTMVLTRKRGGKSKIVILPGRQLPKLQLMNHSYRKFRRARARMVKVHQQMLKHLSVIEAHQLALGEKRWRKISES